MKTYILKFNPFLILLILLNGYSTHAQDYAYNTSQGWYYEFDDEWVLCQEFHSEFVYDGGAVLGTYDDCGHAMEWDVPWDEINPEENPYNPTPSYPTSDSGNDSYSYEDPAYNDQEGGGVYTAGSENGPPNNNGLDEPENYCPCCGSMDHLYFECQCSKSYNPLKCIEDVTPQHEKKNWASIGWDVLNFTFHIFLMVETPPGAPSSIESIDPRYWDIIVELRYNMGSLYGWSGKIIYDCTSKRIIRTDS